MKHFYVFNLSNWCPEITKYTKEVSKTSALLPLKNLLFSLMLVTLTVFSGLAQDQEITGKVIDESGEGLPGVSIYVKNTAVGTVTDFDGNFTIGAPNGSVLVFQYVGYLTQEVQLGAETTLNITLQEDIQALSEVVVVGYGTQQKKDLTGVVAKVNEEDFNGGAIVSSEQLINGKIAGVQVTSNSGEPGGQVSIRIRGGTSLRSNEPLYVIDGIPVDNSANNPGPLQAGRNPLNFINPNDIESITVLKDASAAAIYGSRAANGVIIITTKKGKAGSAAKVTYGGWVSIANDIDRVDVLSAQQFRDVVAEREPGRVDRLGNANTDWQEEILQTAIGQNHTLSFTGGAENLGYRASIGYLEQEGIIINSRTERVSLSFGLNHNLINDDLKMEVNIKAAQTRDNITPNGALGTALRFDPTQPVFDPEGNQQFGGFFEYQEASTINNPVAELELTNDQGLNYRSVGNVRFEYFLPFVEGLSASLNLGYDVTRAERKRFLPTFLKSQVDAADDAGDIRRANVTRRSGILETYVKYVKDLPSIKSSFDVLAGYSYQDFVSEFPEIRAFGLANNLTGFGSARPATQFEVDINETANRLISYYFRLNYTFDDKYLLTATIRRDGSSRFGAGNRYGTFPSVAAAWRIADEAFMEGLSNTVSDLKLRVSWGITGNQEIGDFSFLPTYTIGDNQAQAQFGDNFISTIRPNGVDPNIKWEETESLNIGLDFGFLKGRLSGSIEYYIKDTEDLLSRITVPAGANLTNVVTTNVGSVRNEGFEFSLNAIALDKEDLRWDLGFNFAYNRNEIQQLTVFDDPDFLGFEVGGISGDVGRNIQIQQVGQPAFSYFVFQQLFGPDGRPLIADASANDGAGIDNNGDGVVNMADYFADVNGDGEVNDLDRRPFEQPAPDFILGFTSQLYVKNFDLSFTMRANLGNFVYNNVASNSAFFQGIPNNAGNVENVVSSVFNTGFVDPLRASDIYVENGSFLRMDNLSLGYTFDELLNNKANIRLYVTVQNLFIITDYTGLDPEIGNASSRTDDLRFGIDDNIFPRARTFLFGLNIGL